MSALRQTPMTSARPSTTERALLEAARGGDEHAFRELVEPNRTAMHAHCYRMLGSLHDAEDALQDALLRAWRGLSKFDGRSAFRSWLYRITTNACLDVIARRSKRVLPIDYGSSDDGDAGERLASAARVEPYPDEVLGLEEGYAAPEARYEQREAVELAFVAAIQRLPTRQRAVLVLREVLGFSAKEVSRSLGMTVPSVNSALQRARRAVDERMPERSQQATLRALGDKRVSEIVEGFVDSFERGDVDGIVGLLTEDATFTVPPHTGRIAGGAHRRLLAHARWTSPRAWAAHAPTRTASWRWAHTGSTRCRTAFSPSSSSSPHGERGSPTSRPSASPRPGSRR